MATTAEIRNGLCIEFNEQLFQVVSFQHVKPGKGPAFVRTKLKNLKTGKVIDNTFSVGTKINTVRIERRPYQFLYKDEMGFNFMNSETFEQVSIGTEQMKDEELVDNMQAVLRVLDGKLKRGLKNVKYAFIKTSMGEPVKIKP